MSNFTLLVQDDRYTVPTVLFLIVDNVLRAAEIATNQLSESPHHLAVELCDGNRPLAQIDRNGVRWLRSGNIVEIG